MDKQLLLSRLKLLLVAAIFFGPLVGAAVLYYGFPQLAPAGHTHKGHLLSPARPLPGLDLQSADGTAADRGVFVNERWTFLYFSTGPCAKTCLKRLYDTRQVRTSLGRLATRVQRILVVSDAADLPPAELVKRQHPDLEIYVSTGSALRDFLNNTVEQAGRNGDVYVFDPLGNWVLYYQPQDPAKGLLEDIKHLLKLSSIG